MMVETMDLRMARLKVERTAQMMASKKVLTKELKTAEMRG